MDGVNSSESAAWDGEEERFAIVCRDESRRRGFDGRRPAQLERLSLFGHLLT